MNSGAIYVRVSTEDQAREGYSIDAQIKAIKKYAKDHNIFIDPKYIFKDEGFSGRKAEKRPAFMQMIATAKTKPKPFDYIIVHKFDRFARNREDSIVYKSLLKRECNISVVSVSEPIDKEDKTSIIMEAFFESMAEYYSMNLSEEVSKGQLEKHSRGELQTCPSLGYDVLNNTLVINEEEAKIVRYVFDRYINNTPMLTIAKELNNLGYRTKKNNKFENRQIHYILNNITYIGKLRYTPGGRKNRNFKDENTIYSDGKHQPIISDDIWNQAQKLLEENSKFAKPRRQNHDVDCWLKGIIRCCECNSTFVKCGKFKLRCNGYNKGTCSNGNTINKEEAKILIIEQIKHDMNHGTIQNIVDKTKSISMSTKRELIINKLKQTNTKFERIKYAFIEGIDSAEEYKNNKKELLKEKQQLEEEIKKLNIPITKEARRKQIIENGKSAFEILSNDKITEQEKHTIIHNLLDKIEYNPEENELTLFYN